MAMPVDDVISAQELPMHILERNALQSYKLLNNLINYDTHLR